MQLQAPHRVCLHIDLDAFYAQVEQKRLNIPRDTPCAVQQWEGLIAVNYAARAAGVTRHMRWREAKRVCPELQLVHVETIGMDGTSDGAGTEGSGAAKQRESAKASLQRYRRASAEIMRLLAQQAPSAVIEKASIDEAYLDITDMVRAKLAQLQPDGTDGGTAGSDSGPLGEDLQQLCQRAEEHSIVVGGPLQPDLHYDRWLAVGAAIAARLRAAVLERLSFTCSAGCACNKLVAKLASAMNKPNKQTVVTPRAVPGLMQDMPLSRIKGLGGKLGAGLEALGLKTAGQVAAMPFGELCRQFPDKARWILDTVRGIDEEPVTAKDKVKSINSCKSFNPTSELAEVTRWMAVLCEELAERMAQDEDDNRRHAKTLVLHHRTANSAGERSIRCPMPPFGREGPTPAALAAAGMALYHRLPPEAKNVCRLALTATDFVDAPVDGASSIARFLQPASRAAGGGEARPSGGAAAQSQQQQQQQQQEEGGGAGGRPHCKRSKGSIASFFAARPPVAQTSRNESKQEPLPLPGGQQEQHNDEQQHSVQQQPRPPQDQATAATVQQQVSNQRHLHQQSAQQPSSPVQQQPDQPEASCSLPTGHGGHAHHAAPAEHRPSTSAQQPHSKPDEQEGGSTLAASPSANPHSNDRFHAGIDLAAVDAEDQRRILQDIQKRSAARLVNRPGKRSLDSSASSGAHKKSSSKQLNIMSMLRR